MNELLLVLNLLFLFINGFVLFYLRVRIVKVNKKEQAVAQSSLKILDEAHAKANSILTAYIKKAKETLTHAEYLKENLVTELEKSLSDVAKKDMMLLEDKSAEVDNFYKKLLEDIKAEHIKKADETLSSVEKIADDELSDFRALLKKETTQSEDIITKRVNEEFEHTQKEIADYKESKLKQIDQEVNKMIVTVAREVLGKTISLHEHEQLIFDSLEKAKSDGLFTSKI